jgi:hypothetical protein
MTTDGTRRSPQGALGQGPPAQEEGSREGAGSAVGREAGAEAPPLDQVYEFELSFARTSSLTTRGSALPWVSFITCPTKKPSRPSLPPR